MSQSAFSAVSSTHGLQEEGTGWHFTHCFSGPVSDHIAGLRFPSFRVCGSFFLSLPRGLPALTSSQVPTGSAYVAMPLLAPRSTALCLPCHRVWPQLPLVEAAQPSCVPTAAGVLPAALVPASGLWELGWSLKTPSYSASVSSVWLDAEGQEVSSIAGQLCSLESGLSLGPGFQPPPPQPPP